MFEAVRWFARRVLHKLRHNSVSEWIYLDRELIICAADERAARGCTVQSDIQKNNIERLDEVAALVAGRAADLARREMQASLAGGNEMFTCEIGGCVAGVGWSNPGDSSAYFPYVRQRLDFGGLRVVALYSAFVSPQFRRQGVYRRLFQARACDAFACHSARIIICAEEGGNSSARRAHEVLGMEVVGRFRVSRRLGREHNGFHPEQNTLGLTVLHTGPGHWQLNLEAADGERSRP
ncbi:hypothetical protein GCM10027297_36040 [Parahaliea aestuarii]